MTEETIVEVKKIKRATVCITLNAVSNVIMVVDLPNSDVFKQLDMWQAGNASLVYYKTFDANTCTFSGKAIAGKGLGLISIVQIYAIDAIDNVTFEEIETVDIVIPPKVTKT